MRIVALMLVLLLAGCAGGGRRGNDAPLFNINVSSVEERLDDAPVVEAPPPKPKVVTRLVPTVPPRVCQCR